MSNVAIRVEGLGKRYRVGLARRHDTLRDSIAERVSDLWRRPRRSSLTQESDEDLWALRDVTFDVQRGEVLGVVGRNGAGKSTLLKILSRITEPTEGCAQIRGRVASLLEVGVGFHPELTARENIYVNGAILGMKRAEIRARFDEILAFAEIERFVDTPVKHLSSGMYVRLAFSVAAHLVPGILIVDEVLAVGDAGFQKKCIGKMGSVAREGRTVLFVSHNMAAVSALCTSAMVLRDGRVEFPPNEVERAVSNYLIQVSDLTRLSVAERTDRSGMGSVRITHFAAYDEAGNQQASLISGQRVEFRLYYESTTPHQPTEVIAAISFTAVGGAFITMLSNQVASEPFDTISTSGHLSCVIQKLPLAQGSYSINLIIREREVIQDWIQEAVVLTVEGGDFYGTGRIPPRSHAGIFIEQAWFAS